MSSLSLVRDVLWEKALSSQPEPLVPALRVAGLDDPGVLLNYPRNEDIQGPGLEVPSGAASLDHRSTSACDLTVTMLSRTATGSSAVASAACGWTLVTGGNPKTDRAFSSLGGDPETGHASFTTETCGDPKTDLAFSLEMAASFQPTMLPCVHRCLSGWPRPVLPIGRGSWQPKLPQLTLLLLD